MLTKEAKKKFSKGFAYHLAEDDKTTKILVGLQMKRQQKYEKKDFFEKAIREVDKQNRELKKKAGLQYVREADIQRAINGEIEYKDLAPKGRGKGKATPKTRKPPPRKKFDDDSGALEDGLDSECAARLAQNREQRLEDERCAAERTRQTELRRSGRARNKVDKDKEEEEPSQLERKQRNKNLTEEQVVERIKKKRGQNKENTTPSQPTQQPTQQKGSATPHK